MDAAGGVAQAFAAAESETVVGYLEDESEELRLRGNQPGERWYHEYLREKAPGFALARHWAGLDQEAELLRREIARLRLLISGAAYDVERRSGAQSSTPAPRARGAVTTQDRDDPGPDQSRLRVLRPREVVPLKDIPADLRRALQRVGLLIDRQRDSHRRSFFRCDDCWHRLPPDRRTTPRPAAGETRSRKIYTWCALAHGWNLPAC